MLEWRERAQIFADVVCFNYTQTGHSKLSEEVYVWDLDKTYLDTTFESFKGIWKTIFEKAGQKKNVPGTATLVRALQDAWQERFEEIEVPIYFITASPPQMETKIVEKLNLDGIQPLGLYCKDNLQNLHPKRLWRLTKQVGFKLQALLQMRLSLFEDVRQIMWGDDSESDVIIYSLYSDICARRMNSSELEKVLKSFHVTGAQLKTIFELQDRIPLQDPVEKIYINLAEDTDSEYYLKFGRRTVASFNTFQTSLDLFQDGRIQLQHVLIIAEDMLNNFGYTVDELGRSLDDLIRRQTLGEPCVKEVVPALQKQGLIQEHFEPSLPPKPVSAQLGDRVMKLEGNFEPWVPERIDYLHNYR